MLSRTSLLGILGVVGLFIIASLHADPLHDAAAQGDIEEVNRLIAQGADVDAKAEPYGVTALFIASNKGHQGIVKALLAPGANVNLRENGGGTALKYRKTEEIKQLLKAAGATQ